MVLDSEQDSELVGQFGKLAVAVEVVAAVAAAETGSGRDSQYTAAFAAEGIAAVAVAVAVVGQDSPSFEVAWASLCTVIAGLQIEAAVAGHTVGHTAGCRRVIVVDLVGQNCRPGTSWNWSTSWLVCATDVTSDMIPKMLEESEGAKVGGS